MLKDLKIKIAMQNIPILVSFVCVFCIVIIAFLSGIMTAASLKYTNKIIQGAFTVSNDQLNINNDFLKESLYSSQNLFSQFEESYIVYNSEINVYAVHNINEKMQESIKIFAYDVSQNDSIKVDSIIVNKVPYRIVTQKIKGENKAWVVQVVQNITQEKKILSLFTKAMIIMGGAGVLTMIALGWYFAGKRLGPITEVYLKQRRFIADASHEIKTPLTIIQTNVDVLRAKENFPIKENLNWLDNIESEVLAMRSLIDDMLMLANAEDIGLDLDLEQIHLSELIKDTCMRQMPMSKSRDVNLHYSQQCDIVATADKNRIEQLVKIFVDNASKYNKKGGNVWVRLYLENNNVVLEFEDDGIGMHPDEIVHVFERFFRADKARKRDRQPSGFGLGLSIAKEIIEAHDGIVQVESEKGRGTTFKITFYNMAVI
ncbi:MAG: HAMP domain-containing histidine kinase [Eubacteriaceae bacterium]|nr:HAMP domain-containing histidine kinase [Eubacteriaceae bacterium]